ncbi:hypothetical protein AN220_00535 [Streptomyces nanshensis]|nr:hypothetical protein AN220_00535 [Streptomyces nanshensis]
MAEAVSRRGDCSRRKIGAVIVDGDRRIQATGYNGTVSGVRGCLSGACPRATSNVAPGTDYDTGNGFCIALHAESNALLYSSRDQRLGSTMYVTDGPCSGCLKLIIGSGLKKVVWRTMSGSMRYMTI